MKQRTIIVAIGMSMLAFHATAQSPIIFRNDLSSRVTNSLTGRAVEVGNAFNVALYAAPDGTTDENAFVVLGEPVGFGPVAGIFDGGGRTVPMVPPYSYGMFQVRGWETAYGNSYETAAAAPAMNGRKALVGKSNLVRARTGDSLHIPEELTSAGLRGFALTADPVPSVYINDIVVSEGTNGTKQAVFDVALLPPATGTASVDFFTMDGSAVAGSDYVTANGTLSFASGETNKTIAITLTPDVPAEPDEDFFVILTNAVNVAVGKAQGHCVITEVRVEGISVDVAVTFNTVLGHRYILEKSDDMATWSVVTGVAEVVGTGSSVTVYDRGGGCQAHRLYRARLLE